LLNYYDDDVGELYMYMCIYVVGDFFLCAIGVDLMMEACIEICWCWLLKSCEYMHCCCCWVISSHTLLMLDFISMLLTNTFYSIIRVEIWCVCCIMGWRPRSWLGISRVLSRSRHIACLGWVIIVYVFGDNCALDEYLWLVMIVYWWILVIGESYTWWCVVKTWRCVLVDVCC